MFWDQKLVFLLETRTKSVTRTSNKDKNWKNQLDLGTKILIYSNDYISGPKLQKSAKVNVTRTSNKDQIARKKNLFRTKIEKIGYI